MPSHDNDDRFNLFGPRTRPRTETLTRCDENDEPDPSEERAAARTVWDGDAVDDPSDVEFDRTWHVILVQLLGRLEFGRCSLADPAHRKNPAGAVRVASAMVSQVADFIVANVDSQKHRRPIEDSLAAAGRFLTAAQVAAGEPVSRGFFARLGGRSPESKVKLQECMWVLRDMPLVLERYFFLLGGCFRGRKFALEWVDTSGVYITELKQTLGWVEGFSN
ncbi:MAG: hypothetical protein JNK93_01660 [Planctomycetia bacterium]|nr:hypothetical protein [Planctomycetia bacterium]